MTAIDVMLLVVWFVGSFGGGWVAGACLADREYALAAWCLIPIGIGVAAAVVLW